MGAKEPGFNEASPAEAYNPGRRPVAQGCQALHGSAGPFSASKDEMAVGPDSSSNPHIRKSVPFPHRKNFGAARKFELYDYFLHRNLGTLHGSNLIALIQELVLKGDFKSVATTVASVMGMFDTDDRIGSSAGRQGDPKRQLLRLAVKAGLEVAMQNHFRTDENSQQQKLPKYLAAAMSMLAIQKRDRQALEMEMAYCHLGNGDLMMAYESLGRIEPNTTGAAAGRSDPAHSFRKAAHRGLIRHFQWLQSMKRDFERLNISDYNSWFFNRSAWQRIALQTRDYWNDACKNLKEALNLRPESCALAYVLAHLCIRGGRPAQALDAAQGCALSSPDDPDALALLCLVLQAVGSSVADDVDAGSHEESQDAGGTKGKRKRKARAGEMDGSTGSNSKRSRPGTDIGLNVDQRLANNHIRLFSAFPESLDALEGFLNTSPALRPVDVLEATLLHIDATCTETDLVGLGGNETECGLEYVCRGWDLVRSALEGCCVSQALCTPVDKDRVGDLLSERSAWWGRCPHFWHDPRAWAAPKRLLAAKACCAAFVLEPAHVWRDHSALSEAHGPERNASFMSEVRRAEVAADSLRCLLQDTAPSGSGVDGSAAAFQSLPDQETGCGVENAASDSTSKTSTSSDSAGEAEHGDSTSETNRNKRPELHRQWMEKAMPDEWKAVFPAFRRTIRKRAEDSR